MKGSSFFYIQIEACLGTFETGAPCGDGFYAQLSAAKESVIGLFPYQRRRERLTPYHLFEPIATENTCGVRGHESNRRWWSRFWSRTYADTAPLALLHPFLHKCYDDLSYCTSPHYRLIYTRIYFSGMCECVMFSSHAAFRPFLVELLLHVAEAVDLWLVALQSRWHASRQHSSSSRLASLDMYSYDGVSGLPFCGS